MWVDVFNWFLAWLLQVTGAPLPPGVSLWFHLYIP